MLVTRTLTVGDLETNCYLVTDKSTDQTFIVDPGDDADFITQTIVENNLKPISIILTHGHFDHVLGCLELKLNFDIPIYLDRDDETLYNSANQSASHWLKKKTLKVPPIDHFLSNHQKLELGDSTLEVIKTPGHTRGSVCLYDGHHLLFSGDTVFSDSVGRTDFSYSQPLQLTKSLDLLKKLDPNTTVYSGHGSVFLLGDSPIFSK